MNQHPFEQKLYRGECTPEEIKRWLINRYFFEETMMRKDCVILANSDNHEFRKVWVKRVLDSQAPGGGLDQWRTMCSSAGILPEELLNVTPGAQRACEKYLEMCRTTDWKIVVAGSLSQIQAALNHQKKCDTWYDFYPGIDWSYFKVRKQQAEQDSQSCLRFIEQWELHPDHRTTAAKHKKQLMNDILDDC
jgi:pyrroloquinoline-quinone synthase